MNRSKLLLVLFITISQIGITAYAQKVNNITFRQEQSNIIVLYDLETKTPCKVSLYVSTNDGKTWQGPLTKVIDAVGDKIASGSHSITWNVLEEFEELRGDKIMFQVRAVGDNIETVKIGTQEWTTKNLDVSKYRNGDEIPYVSDRNAWALLTIGAWCYNYDNPTSGYGKLFNWYAVNDRRGLAPKGFHIPTDAEWTTLTNTLGGQSVAGGKMKSTGTSLWLSPNTNATNESGFSGLMGGIRSSWGAFNGSDGMWWSSSEDDNRSYAICRVLKNSSGKVFRYGHIKDQGFSVRCIRD